MSDYRLVSFWREGVSYKPMPEVPGYIVKKSSV
jgi:hypothetical protein